MHPLLHIKELTIDFKTEDQRVNAVKNVHLVLNRNEVLGIAGESGSGKSVTALAVLRLLSPLARITAGEINFSHDGISVVNLLQISEADLRQVRGKHIAMIFQEPMTSLNPVYTCGEQVAEAMRLHEALTAAQARKRTVELFEKVKLPEPASLFDRYPHQLSGGQKQRVMIAMAMSGNPSVLICDEPTTALDVTVQNSVLELLRELQSETGMGIIFISHDLAVLAQLASRVAIMYKGEVLETGPARQILSEPSHAYTRALLACRPALYQKGERLPVVSDFIVGAQDKRKQNVPQRSPEQTGSDPLPAAILKVENLTVKFPRKAGLTGTGTEFTTAVDNVSFELYDRETLGLVGESGCGKTTLGRAVLRLVEPSQGTIYYRNTDLMRLSRKEMRQVRPRLQLVFQDPYSSLNPSQTVGTLITEPMAVHRNTLNSRKRRDTAVELLEKVGLSAAHMDRYPHEFSGGQRQRIVIARALVLQPELLVCDESVSALDVSVQAQVLNLLNDLKAELRFSVIFISHDISVVRYLSNRIMVMHKGRIEEAGPAAQVCTTPRSEYTRRLLEAMPRLNTLI